MKRDWDTIRKILTTLEDSTSTNSTLQLSDFLSDEEEKISYHTELLLEANLIDGEMIKTIGNGINNFCITRLTWNGHEFLDVINNDTVWRKTKKLFTTSGISMTFELVKSIATDTATSILKSTLGN
jgi:hypothetical protein